MKKIACFLILSLLAVSGYTQNIKVDIFGDLEYKEKGYKAFLKKDIFGNLIFTDTNDNELTYEKKYLQKNNPILLESKNAKVDFFRFLIHQYGSDNGYKALFSVDIFDTEIIEDNRDNKIKRGTNIFGHPNYEERINGQRGFLRKDLSDTWQYKRGRKEASLQKDVFGNWCYTDSYENKFEISPQTWEILLYRHRSEENIFIFLLTEFLLDS